MQNSLRTVVKNLVLGLSQCAVSESFQEGKRPIKEFGERPTKVVKRPNAPLMLIIVMGCFLTLPALQETFVRSFFEFDWGFGIKLAEIFGEFSVVSASQGTKHRKFSGKIRSIFQSNIWEKSNKLGTFLSACFLTYHCARNYYRNNSPE